MVYFVTGASSFIGIELCRYLTENGHEVIAMSRNANAQLDEIANGGRLKVFDATMQNLTERVKDVTADVFIHLAWAGTKQEERNNPAVQNENVKFSLEYVKLAQRMGCKLYVDAGSQAEYGIVQGTITEETPCHPFSAYGKAKLRMYHESCKLTEQMGMKYIHLRILSVYGEQDHPNTLVISSMRKLQANEPIEMRSGGQKWNYVYVKDAARQIAELSFFALSNDNFRHEVYNIASNDTRQLQDFVTVMKVICQSSSMLNFGGYDPEKDVNLTPDRSKTEGIIKPLTEYRFEEIIRKMTSDL